MVHTTGAGAVTHDTSYRILYLRRGIRENATAATRPSHRLKTKGGRRTTHTLIGPKQTVGPLMILRTGSQIKAGPGPGTPTAMTAATTNALVVDSAVLRGQSKSLFVLGSGSETLLSTTLLR